MSPPSVIPQGSTVLVTGVNGYIGSHVADQLLLAGYKVRGAARDATKAKWVQEVFDKKYGPGKYESIIVPNMIAEGAYDEAAKGVAGIAHVASNLSFSSDAKTVISETIKGALNALRAAAKQPTVKRVVLTSSTAAVFHVKPSTPFEVTTEWWNDEAVKLAWDSVENPPAPGSPEASLLPVVIYAASKTEEEKACWKFMEDEKPGFEFNTVLPNTNLGPPLSKDQAASTGAWVGQALRGEPEILHWAAAIGPQHYVDVRDTGRLHVAALTNPSVKSERIFAAAAPFTWAAIFSVLRKAYPDAKVPDDIPNEVEDTARFKTWGRSVELLKALGQDGYISLEESVKDNAKVYA